MVRRRHTPEQVIIRLGDTEVLISEGSTVAEAARRMDLLPVARRVRGPQDRPGPDA